MRVWTDNFQIESYTFPKWKLMDFEDLRLLRLMCCEGAMKHCR